MEVSPHILDETGLPRSRQTSALQPSRWVPWAPWAQQRVPGRGESGVVSGSQHWRRLDQGKEETLRQILWQIVYG